MRKFSIKCGKRFRCSQIFMLTIAMLCETNLFTASPLSAQVKPAVDEVAKKLRADRTRALAVDSVAVDMQIVDADGVVNPELRQRFTEERLDRLNLLIDKGWLSDISATLARGINLKPEAAPRMTRVIVDTIFAQPEDPTTTFGFCALKSVTDCNAKPITVTELGAMRGFPSRPLTPELSINRIIPISKPAGVALGATYAAQDGEAAKKLKPLDAINVEAIAWLCEINDNSPNSPSLKRCVQAGILLYLLRKGLN